MMEPSSLEHWDAHACSVANNCLVNTSPLYNGLIEYNPETDIPRTLPWTWPRAGSWLMMVLPTPSR